MESRRVFFVAQLFYFNTEVRLIQSPPQKVKVQFLLTFCLKNGCFRNQSFSDFEK